jgi:hypothetical protein
MACNRDIFTLLYYSKRSEMSDAFHQLTISFASEDERKEGLKLNEIHQHLGENVDSVLQYTADAVLQASKVDGFGNKEETKCMLRYCPHNAEQNYDIRVIS